jgi:hypothetical protein
MQKFEEWKWPDQSGKMTMTIETVDKAGIRHRVTKKQLSLS